MAEDFLKLNVEGSSPFARFDLPGMNPVSHLPGGDWASGFLAILTGSCFLPLTLL